MRRWSLFIFYSLFWNILRNGLWNQIVGLRRWHTHRNVWEIGNWGIILRFCIDDCVIIDFYGSLRGICLIVLRSELWHSCIGFNFWGNSFLFLGFGHICDNYRWLVFYLLSRYCWLYCFFFYIFQFLQIIFDITLDLFLSWLLNTLHSFQVSLYLVFDGSNIPGLLIDRSFNNKVNILVPL